MQPDQMFQVLVIDADATCLYSEFLFGRITNIWHLDKLKHNYIMKFIENVQSKMDDSNQK